MTDTMRTPAQQAIEQGTWGIDASHSVVEFTARHLMVSKVRGTFTQVEGAVTIPEDPIQASVRASIDARSLTTGDQKRDEHLRGGDFFDVDNHPTIEFKSTGVREVEGSRYVLTGDLTIKGVTRPIELDLEFLGTVGDPWGGTRAAFSATTEVNRKDWGLEWNVALESGGFLVGDKVKIDLEIQAVKQ